MATTYTVQANENLTKIAAAHNTTVEKLVKLNNISDPNKISVGQKLIFEEAKKEAPKPPVEEEPIGIDTFRRTSTTQPSEASTYTPLAYAAGGAALYQGGKWAMPKVKSGMETLQLRGMYAQDAAKRTLNNAAQKSKQTATAVKTFVSQKAKHALKSAELHYAFGKDAVEQRIQKGKDAVKQTAQKSKTVVQEGAKKAVQKGQTVVGQAKTTAKAAAHKGKVAARYTRFVGNTKVAPKLIKGVSRYAAPAAALYGAYEVKKAYDEGGEKAAVKQAVKTGGGLAGGWAGAKVGAAIGSFAGPIGTVAGGIIGGIAGYMLGEKLCS